MALYCKDCGGRYADDTERGRCICGGTFRDEPGEQRPQRLLAVLRTHSWIRRTAGHDVVEHDDGDISVVFEFE